MAFFGIFELLAVESFGSMMRGNVWIGFWVVEYCLVVVFGVGYSGDFFDAGVLCRL